MSWSDEGKPNPDSSADTSETSSRIQDCGTELVIQDWKSLTPGNFSVLRAVPSLLCIYIPRAHSAINSEQT